jgi:hypothetical protein
MKKLSMCIPALALAAACGGSVNEFAASTPDVRGQSIELTGSSAEGATFLQEGAGVSSQDLSNPPEYLAKTRAAIKGLNDLVKKFVTPVVDAVAAGGKDVTGTADTKVFGPKDENGITWKLTVRRISGRRFGWVLEGKPLGQFDSAYKRVAAGALQRSGNAEHRGAGRTSIDLDAYASIDPTSHAQGKLFNAFKHFGDDGEARVVVYALKGFTVDSTVAAPGDAVVYGHKSASGETVVRVAAFSETLAPSTAGAADAGAELMLARLRFIPTVGGRADVYYPSTTGTLGLNSNGDVPSGKYIAAKSCWDKTEQEGFKAVAICNAGQAVSTANCQISIEGVESTACKRGIDREDRMSDTDENDVSAESDAPGKLDDAPASSMSETEHG